MDEALQLSIAVNLDLAETDVPASMLETLDHALAKLKCLLYI